MPSSCARVSCRIEIAGEETVHDIIQPAGTKYSVIKLSSDQIRAGARNKNWSDATRCVGKGRTAFYARRYVVSGSNRARGVRPLKTRKNKKKKMEKKKILASETRENCARLSTFVVVVVAPIWKKFPVAV